MATPLATLEDLQGAVPGIDPTTGNSAIARASALVRAIAGQSFDFVSGDTILLVGGRPVLLLPEEPIVVTDDEPLTVVEMSGAQQVETLLSPQSYVRVGPVLRKLRPGRLWAPYVQVTYSHGFAPGDVPDWLSTIVINAAVKYAVSPTGQALAAKSEKVGGIEVSETYQRSSSEDSDGVAALVADELALAGIGRRGAWTIEPSP